MIDYNVPGGKLNRGMAVYDVLAAIQGAGAISRPDAFRANAVGWCIEWARFAPLLRSTRCPVAPLLPRSLSLSLSLFLSLLARLLLPSHICFFAAF